MDNKIRCQSCGMPLGEGFYGTNADGSQNETYCKFCFQKGEYAESDLSVEEMIHRSVQNMTKELQFPVEKAETLARNVIPHLKRWNRIKD